MSTWQAPHFEAGSIRAAAVHTYWMEAARLALARHGLSDTLLGMAQTGSDVVIAGERLFFKMTAPRFQDELSAEERLLSFVAGQLPVATPRVVASGELDGWPYLIMTRVLGTPLSQVLPLVEHRERVALAASLGELVAALHRLPLPDDGAGWAPFLSACVESAPTRHKSAGVPLVLSDAVGAFLSRVERPDRELALLHTEVLDEHVLASFDGQRWRLCSMLDFADGRVGHPEYELPALVEFIFRGEPGLLAAFLRAYGLGEGLDGYEERLLSWGLIHRFGSLPRMLRVLGEPTPNTLEELARRLYCL